MNIFKKYTTITKKLQVLQEPKIALEFKNIFHIIILYIFVKNLSECRGKRRSNWAGSKFYPMFALYLSLIRYIF